VRISLIHNPTAGDGVSFDEIRRELEGAGYEIAREIEKDSDFERVLEEPVEFVAIAGGDGTVRRAGRALAGRGVPLAILPIGTANNIAAGLGIRGSVRDVVSGWKKNRREPFDMGVARGQWGDSLFLEGVGSGLVTAGIAAAEDHPSAQNEDARTARARALRTYRETLARIAPSPWLLTVDDAAIEGEFLMVEVLNIPSVGANLALAPDADPSDGLFDIVTAGEAERKQLAAYLDARIAGRESRLSLPTRRGRLGTDAPGRRAPEDLAEGDRLDRDPAPRPRVRDLSLGASARGGASG
jgi:diacylglycerol kinase family enzyme